jgi:hypothetical protein
VKKMCKLACPFGRCENSLLYYKSVNFKQLRWLDMADLKDCPFGFDIKDDCKNCDYSDTNHYDPVTGKCVKR